MAALEAVRGELVELRADEKVTFTDLAFAHYLRQTTMYAAAQPRRFRQRSRSRARSSFGLHKSPQAFERERGSIIRAYWCTHEISGVVITEERIRLPWWELRRIERRQRLHAATEWATRDSPEFAHQLHKIDNLSVRSDEILRGPAENIAMQLLACAASRLLSYVDS